MKMGHSTFALLKNQLPFENGKAYSGEDSGDFEEQIKGKTFYWSKGKNLRIWIGRIVIYLDLTNFLDFRERFVRFCNVGCFLMISV